ncbi:MAG: Stp1/IreP family PP2C-type Ser/Thr phosphatase [Atopobiaceae bacterium]|jgi:serine/threonine protein phosphatase PrpC|nr:Stp1/IreP family PP2C-type Ser/Thr phosphatase [Atopobiaceae bacterium]MCI2050567.1 Stp1/IreP family PP2C-type Ser/Thr phosphatase [Atopobiaceae bacterium]
MRLPFSKKQQADTGEERRPEPAPAPGHESLPVKDRMDADVVTGHSARLSWGSRSDVGLVRGHNEDSFLVQDPVFAVCDGVGGHAAGEVASAIAVRTISQLAPDTADDARLGAAIEEANSAIISAAQSGQGRDGMGCTASAVVIDGSRMAVAHVGDSRVYLLSGGVLVRITHDHSYVEELVDAGEITADEARVHPSRSIITRALGSDPDMYADHFTLDVHAGDRIIICSDGLSSMVPDAKIESVAISCATPQAAADTLVSAALEGGGHDNVTVIIVDVEDDGTAARHAKIRKRQALVWVIVLAILFGLGAFIGVNIVDSSWYLGNNGGTVGIYQGIDAQILNVPLSHLVETTSVEVDDLPQAVQSQLAQDGIRMESEEKALSAVNSYHEQIDAEKTSAAAVASDVKSSTTDTTQESTSTDTNASQDTSTTDTAQSSTQEGQGE